MFGKARRNLHYVVIESHVEHAVGLVKNEKFYFREVDVAHLEMCEKAPGGGDYDFGATFEGALLLGESGSISAAVDGKRAYWQKI